MITLALAGFDAASCNISIRLLIDELERRGTAAPSFPSESPLLNDGVSRIDDARAI